MANDAIAATSRAVARFATAASVGPRCARTGAGGIPDRRPSGQTGRVGYNPYRRFKARPSDYVLVVACALVAIALLIWAFAG